MPNRPARTPARVPSSTYMKPMTRFLSLSDEGS
jgi:hypothetical protein